MGLLKLSQKDLLFSIRLKSRRVPWLSSNSLTRSKRDTRLKFLWLPVEELLSTTLTCLVTSIRIDLACTPNSSTRKLLKKTSLLPATTWSSNLEERLLTMAVTSRCHPASTTSDESLAIPKEAKCSIKIKKRNINSFDGRVSPYIISELHKPKLLRTTCGKPVDRKSVV